MNGIEIIEFIGTSFPKNQARAQMALGLAIKLAHERWTDADDDNFKAEYKMFIFEWAKAIDKIPQEVWKPVKYGIPPKNL